MKSYERFDLTKKYIQCIYISNFFYFFFHFFKNRIFTFNYTTKRIIHKKENKSNSSFSRSSIIFQMSFCIKKARENFTKKSLIIFSVFTIMYMASFNALMVKVRTSKFARWRGTKDNSEMDGFKSELCFLLLRLPK